MRLDHDSAHDTASYFVKCRYNVHLFYKSCFSEKNEKESFVPPSPPKKEFDRMKGKIIADALLLLVTD